MPASKPRFSHPVSQGEQPCGKRDQQLLAKHKPMSRCTADACYERAYFGDLNGLKPRRCSLHMPSGAASLRKDGEMCIYPACLRVACFGLRCDARATWCFGHRQPAMVNIKSPKCLHPGCNIISSYRPPGGTGRGFCASHKTVDMVYSYNRCAHAGCNKQPSFALPAARKALFCHTHRQPRMVNVSVRKCEHSGCVLPSGDAKPGDTRRRFCTRHHRSETAGAPHSLAHAGAGSSSEVHHGTTGASTGCSPQTHPFSVPQHMCAAHTQPDTDRVLRPKPVSDRRRPPTAATHKRTKCSNYRCQELAVMGAIKAEFAAEHPCMVFDTSIYRSATSSGSSSIRFRPDMWWDLESHMLIVEVDERQHRKYGTAAEEQRTQQLALDANKPVVFLRFNPDEYQDSLGELLEPGLLLVV
ncbi:MAG: hypothetical protein WDW38_010552 [Sanguina aurantia]